MILVPDFPTIERTASSDAEKKVARLLHKVEGNQDAVAFHSVKLRSHRIKQQAEADFVILWNGVVVVVEVKGGGVQSWHGKWWTRDRRGDWAELRESPMDQADGAKQALRNILKEDGIGWYADQHAVITPDVEEVSHAIGWYPSHWLASPHMSVSSLTQALDAITDRATSPPRHAKRALVPEIRKRLYGEFSRLPTIDALRGEVLEAQSLATDGQAKYLEGLARNPRILVLGGAGTGKSLALAAGARQEADQGRSVLITYKSPGLTQFFKALIEGTAIDVIPFHELVEHRTYDSVFIDEAQDLMTVDDMDRLDTIIEGGRSKGRWRMFLDQNNQAHIDGIFDEDVYELIIEEAVPFTLPMNVRNTKPMVNLVQDYLGADIGDPSIVHGEALHWHNATGVADVASATKVAEQLIADGARPTSIWIIDATSSALPVTMKRGFTITSPRYAKGLEADRVIVCGLPQQFDEAGCAAFYVAATRARVGLHILTSAEDKNRLKDLVKKRIAAL